MKKKLMLGSGMLGMLEIGSRAVCYERRYIFSLTASLREEHRLMRDAVLLGVHQLLWSRTSFAELGDQVGVWMGFGWTVGR